MECPFIARKGFCYYCDVTNEEIENDIQNKYCWNMCYMDCPSYKANKKDKFI